jgi:hypothetical protein
MLVEVGPFGGVKTTEGPTLSGSWIWPDRGELEGEEDGTFGGVQRWRDSAPSGSSALPEESGITEEDGPFRREFTSINFAWFSHRHSLSSSSSMSIWESFALISLSSSAERTRCSAKARRFPRRNSGRVFSCC